MGSGQVILPPKEIERKGNYNSRALFWMVEKNVWVERVYKGGVLEIGENESFVVCSRHGF